MVAENELFSRIAALEAEVADLRRQKARHEVLCKNIGHPMGLYAEDGVLIMMNSTAAANLGGRPEDFEGRNLREFLPGPVDVYLNRIRNAFATGEIRDYEDLVELPGGSRWFATSFLPVRNEEDRIFAMQIVSVDITRRVEAEKALKKSEARYRQAQEVGHVGSWEYDLEEKRFWGSDEAKRIYGFDPEALDFTIEDVERCIPDRERLHQTLEDLIKKGIPYNLEFDVIQRRTGKRTTISSQAELVCDENGGPVRVLGVIQDITERKRSETALRESEEKLRAIYEAAADVSFVLTGLNGSQPRILSFSPGAEKMFGYTEAEAVGQPVTMLYPPEYESLVPEMRDRVKSGQKGFSGEIPQIRKSGEAFPALLTIRPVYDSEDKVYGALAVSFDLSERKTLEVQLEHARKMEAIGTLAGGIAHDFNNILAAMLGYTELTLGSLPEGSEFKENLNYVITAGKRARNLIRQILNFSRQTEGQKIPVNVAEMVDEALKMLRATLPPAIEIRQDIGAPDLRVLSSPAQLHQVVMNICTNAAQAMENGGGVLSVKLEETRLEPDDTEKLPGLEPGRYLKLTVSDTGTGIGHQVIGHIFDPFFTTKPVDKGTGMGLSVVHGIVKSCGGEILVQSEPGRGAAFSVLLPVAENTAPLAEPAAGMEDLPRGSERIMLVDDEETLAALGKVLLTRLGYRADAFVSSREALDWFKANPDSVDLLITDFIMPRMTGIDLAGEMRRIRPGLPIIITTGYSREPALKEARVLGIRQVATKPLSITTLARMIREALGESGSG